MACSHLKLKANLTLNGFDHPAALSMPIFNIQRKGSFKLSIFSNNFQSFRDFPSAFDVIIHHNYFEILHDTLVIRHLLLI